MDEKFFEEAIGEFAKMKLLTIPKAAQPIIFPRFREFNESDLTKSLEDLMVDQSRFDFSKLLLRCRQNRADRIEREGEENRRQEGAAAERFWHGSVPAKYKGPCVSENCHSCKHIESCAIRAKEWLNCIRIIINKGLGKGGAETVIGYMKTFCGNSEIISEKTTPREISAVS